MSFHPEVLLWRTATLPVYQPQECSRRLSGDFMKKTVREMIDILEALPETDKQSVGEEILRRATAGQRASLETTALILAADQIFLGLDRRED